MKNIIILFVLFAASFISAVDNPMSYQSALFDSDTVKYNGEYYFSGNFMEGDMLVSRDLRNWGWRSHVFSWNNSWHTPFLPENPDRDIHGPHMRYHNGTFHYYAHLEVNSPDHGNIVHATSTDILGPYAETTTIPFAQYIDADTFIDDDGSFHFYSTRVHDGEEKIYYRTMSDLWYLTGDSNYHFIDPAYAWEYGNINEASKVFKYRDRYYMLYNGNLGSDVRDYAIGCIDGNSPTAFRNTADAESSEKYSSPVIRRTVMNGGNNEITRCGQPWVVEGPNVFEKWVGYFAKYEDISSGRDWLAEGQFIDRLYFNGNTLYADAPTHADTAGYHPPPSHPQYLGLFNKATGTLPTDWTLGAGTWSIVDNELRQTTATGFNNIILNHKSSDNFLAEANIKLIGGSSTRAGLCIVKDGTDWLRVGIDQTANKWFYERNNDGSYDSQTYVLPDDFNFQVYHKIQLQKNENTVYIRIDDIPAPTLSSIAVNFNGAASPELFTDGAQAAFDGVVYSIGWDEWNNRIQYWGGTKSGVPSEGIWNFGNWGIDQTETNGYAYIFKGDLMNEYEIDARCNVRTANANVNRRIGIMPVAIDDANYMFAEIDPATTELVVYGISNSVLYSFPNTPIPYNPTPNTWNIRAVKLSDKVIIFVNGKELFTANVSYGLSQVGLVTENQDAIFSSVIVYETKDKTLPSPWKETDLGVVKYPGRSDFTEDFVTINASGWAFWDTRDEGHFVYQEMESDCEIIAKVEMTDPANYWSSGCLMIRETLISNSVMALMAMTKHDANNTNRTQLIWRSITGGGPGATGQDKYRAFPSYMKLTRVGNTFSGYWSQDGTAWELISSQNISMNQTCYIGLAVSANNSDRITGAVFSDVKVKTGWATWIVDADGNWQDSPNWLSGNIPDNIEQTANFTIDISDDRFIYLNQNRTIGSIIASDPSGGPHRWALENGGSGVLTLNNGTEKPVIDVEGDGIWGMTIATPVEGVNGFTKTGDDTLHFWAPNDINGTVTISEGTIDAKVDGVLKNADVVVQTGATFEFAPPCKTLNPKSITVEFGGKIKSTFEDTYTINCPMTLGGGDALSFEANNINITNNGAITLSQSTRIFNWGDGGCMVMNGAVSGIGDLDMIGQAAGIAHTKTYYINAQNSYVGTTFLSTFACSTTFEINGHQRFPYSDLIFRVHEWADEDVNLFVDMNNFTQRVSNLSLYSGTSGGDYIEIRGDANAEIGCGNFTVSGPGLAKLAGGKISVSGLATFNNPLTIENADFIANGSATGNSQLEIGNGGKIGGIGTLANVTVKSGGEIAPGNSIGTLSVANLTLESGSVYEWDISANHTDSINIIGGK